MKLHLVTFNVNGLRSIKDYYAQSKLNNYPAFPDFLNSFDADIICFQEHKTNVASKLSHDLCYPKGYAAFYAFPRIPKKIGYSGVVTFVKESSPWMPIAWYDGFTGFNDKITVPLHHSPLLKSNFSSTELMELDSEGRCIITDHFHFILMNFYFPNDSGPERAEFREKFYKAVHLRSLDLIREHEKSLIILGDINIAYHPLDHCEFAPLMKTITADEIESYLTRSSHCTSHCKNEAALIEFYSNPMRKWLANLVFNDKSIEGWRDCFRLSHPVEGEDGGQKYTCWNTQISARGTNYGTRIDTIFTSGPLFTNNDHFQMCNIMPKVMGSDHCPVIGQFYVLHVSVLKYFKLKKGNIPRSFGNLDSFLELEMRSSRREKEVEVESEQQAVITEQSSTVTNDDKSMSSSKRKRVKISDFFKPESKSQDYNNNHLVQSEPPPLNKQDSLTSIFNRPQSIPPKCRHAEFCHLSKVTKSGPNQGRSFYCCARPGGSAKDPSARCDFFEWLNKSKPKQ